MQTQLYSFVCVISFSWRVENELFKRQTIFIFKIFISLSMFNAEQCRHLSLLTQLDKSNEMIFLNSKCFYEQWKNEN